MGADNSDDETSSWTLSRRQTTGLVGGGLLIAASAWLSRPQPVEEAAGWDQREPLPASRGEMKGATLDGRIYVPGGLVGLGESTDRLTIYDPADDEWTVGKPLPVGLNHHATAALDGRLYVIGGNESFTDPPDTFAFAYDPAADEWAELSELPDGRWAHEALAHDGRLYVLGGVPDDDTEIDTFVYDPATDDWERAAPIPTRREHVAAAVLDGELYVVGGRWDGERSRAVEVYDPIDDEWNERPSLSVGRGGFGAAVIDGQLHAIGGEHSMTVGGWTTAAHERYDPDRDGWEQLEDAPVSVHGHLVVALDDRLYVVGGAWRHGLWSVTAWSDQTFAFDPY